MRLLFKSVKKSVSILLTLTMMIGILVIIPIEASAATGVSYIYRSWDGTNKKVVDTVKTCTDYTELDRRSGDHLKGWYVVSHNTTINSRLYVDDTDPVNIILCDGATLTCPKGFQISYYAKLNIYGQSGDAGKLVTHPNSSSDSPGDSHALIEANGEFNFYGGKLEAECGTELTRFKGAAIGGAKGKNSGTVNLYGGTVDATTHYDSSAIGGGHQGGTGKVRIYGGTVTAKGSTAAPIGNGIEGNSNGSIEIYGGTVTAHSYNFSAAIGGSDGTDGPAVTISGGTVYAFCYHDDGSGAGIGSGRKANRTKPIRITGGVVFAQSTDSAAIGAGCEASASNIDLSGGVVVASASKGGAGIGGGSKGNADSITISGAMVNASSSSYSDSTAFVNAIDSWIDTISFYTPGADVDPDGLRGNAMAALVLFSIKGYALLFSDKNSGCGIGAGYQGTFGNITISNHSEVTANSGKYAAAIGSGDENANGGGTITITDSTVIATAGSDAAGIGTGNECGSACDAINITNSTVTAHGGRYGAGIGGGDDVSGGTINITNSTIKEADSKTDGAGIGGGESGRGGTITIKNSNVTAHGGGYAAGIGGGDHANGGTTTIENSTVKAYGGTDAAGIGGGEDGNGGKIYITNGSNVYAQGKDCGAGIGGGEDASGEYCHIDNGCTVEAVSGGYGNVQSIGHGDCGWYVESYTGGTLSLGNYNVVQAGANSGSTDTFYGNDRFQAIRKNKYAKVAPCTHPSKVWRYDSSLFHTHFCTLCGYRLGSESEKHIWNDDEKCTVCGGTATKVTVSFIEKDSKGKEIRKDLSLIKGVEYTFPECENVPDGTEFICWREGISANYIPGETYLASAGSYEAVYLPLSDTKYIAADGTEQTVRAKVLDGTYDGLTLSEGWYVVDSDYEYRAPFRFIGDVNLIIPDGKTFQSLAPEETGFRFLDGSRTVGYLSVYGQRNQTGTLNLGKNILYYAELNQYGGRIVSTNRSSFGGVRSTLIVRGKIDSGGSLSVARNGVVFKGGNVSFNGAIITAELLIGWTNLSDSFRINGNITVINKGNTHGAVRIANGQKMTDGTNIYSGTLTEAQIKAIQGKTLTPYVEQNYNAPEWKWDNEYREATAVFRSKDGSDIQEIKAKATYEDSGKNRISTARCLFNGQEYKTTQTFQILFDVTVKSASHGTVTANKQTAMIGENIKLDVTPDDGYILSELYYTDSKGKRTAIDGSSFTMPEGSVTVNAVFEADPDQHTHTYNSEPVWKWSDDHNSAEATFTCSFEGCGNTETVQATVTKKYENGKLTFTAVAQFEGKTYTDKKELSCQYFARKEPYIDDKGEYIPGNVEYYIIDGKKYSLDPDKCVLNEINDVSISYFDFVLKGDTYLAVHYVGPYDALKNNELVIPKTYNGRKITGIGSDQSQDIFMQASGKKKQFVLVLNENITEINGYAFWTTWVTKVTGDTSSLNKLGAYAFSWVNSPDGYSLDIRLDYPGGIDYSYGTFNNMNVTIRMKHSAWFLRKNASFNAKSIRYVFTDAHTYGEPVWDWDEDYIGATVTHTCTHPNCKHTESVIATFVDTEDEDGVLVHEAVAVFDDAVYHDIQPVYKTEAGGYIVEVTGRFKGGVDSGKHNMVGSDGFRVVFKDKDGNKVNAPQYIWVAQESASEGIVVDPNGDVSFTKEGDFHVQLTSPDGKTVYSPWITVRAYRGGDDGADEQSSPVIFPGDDMPKTGDAAPTAIAVILLASLSAALFLAMKRRKDEA